MATGGWQRSQSTGMVTFAQSMTALFRSCGLDIVSVLLKARFRNSGEEPPKPVLKKSSWLALSRCAVHILPILVSIILVSVNLTHVYIGTHIRGGIFRDSDDVNLALLQILAKVQELLIVGSTGTILFHMIRSELINGDGIPLGLIGAGIRFSGLSFFWSPEFLCACQYQGRTLRKVLIVASIVLGGFLAATAGPASAVLMVPRQQDWLAGGTPFYLGGKESDIWPDSLAFNSDRDLPICQGSDALALAYCPSGGFNALVSHYEQVDVTAFMATGALPYQGSVSGSNYFYRVNSPNQQFPELVAIGNIRAVNASPTSFITQPHVATAAFQRQLTQDWFDAARERKGASVHNTARYWRNWNIESRTKTQVPAAYVQCSKAQNLTIDGKTTIEYPTFPFDLRQTSNVETKMSAEDSKDRPVVAAWADLDPLIWQNITTSLLVAFPDPSNTYALALGCSVQASWYPASILHDVSQSYAFDTYGIEFQSPRHISIERSWLDLLTPKLNNQDDMSSRSSTSSALEYLIAKAHLTPSEPNDTATATTIWNDEVFLIGGNKTTYLESIIASMFADGLARLGVASILNNTDAPAVGSNLRSYAPIAGPHFYDAILEGRPALNPPSASSEDFRQLRINVTIPQAWGYNSNSTTDYLALAVVLFHAVAALGHILWCLIVSRGVTSGCWDSMAEMLALAQNSRPAIERRMLGNTGAGIHRGRTYRCMAKVRVARWHEAGGRQEEEGVGGGGGEADDANDAAHDHNNEGSNEHVELIYFDENNGDADNDANENNHNYNELDDLHTHEHHAPVSSPSMTSSGSDSERARLRKLKPSIGLHRLDAASDDARNFSLRSRRDVRSSSGRVQSSCLGHVEVDALYS